MSFKGIAFIQGRRKKPSSRAHSGSALLPVCLCPLVSAAELSDQPSVTLAAGPAGRLAGKNCLVASRDVCVEKRRCFQPSCVRVWGLDQSLKKKIKMKHSRVLADDRLD
ncbi:hypothetical protein JOB18_049632 [Solea senegalensis]|uniref:Uncharacterized protein n=1 Tax=Solea senegalensis TaxID=28829 RepID=A0AAV6Q5V4_SOLSE|nr:hypothetical protein JOB18_049632 [Solea senegalensis]